MAVVGRCDGSAIEVNCYAMQAAATDVFLLQASIN